MQMMKRERTPALVGSNQNMTPRLNFVKRPCQDLVFKHPPGNLEVEGAFSSLNTHRSLFRELMVALIATSVEFHGNTIPENVI